MNHLVIRATDITKVVISEINVLIIENTATSITAALMCELIKNKVKVMFCDEKRSPFFELTPYYGSHDTSIKIKQQINWGRELKKEVWTLIVKEKILKQAKLLEEIGSKEGDMLRKYIDEVTFNDETNREGHAAKVYFNALYGHEFSRRNENCINAALNYGYSILLSAFNKEIVACGILTQLGLFHDNMYNQYNLSCDLMEPYRVIIDRFVINNQFNEFGKNEKEKVIQILNKQVFIDGTKQYLLNSIRIYVKSVIDVLNDTEGAYIKFYKYEL